MSSELKPPLEFIDKMHDWLAEHTGNTLGHRTIARMAWKYFQDSQYYATAQHSSNASLAVESYDDKFERMGRRKQDLTAQQPALEENYISAVKGRADFRNAFRRERELRKEFEQRSDAYGLALMMIANGCGDVQGFAKAQLDKHALTSQNSTVPRTLAAATSALSQGEDSTVAKQEATPRVELAQALNIIKNYPITDPSNMDAFNMAKLAKEALTSQTPAETKETL